MTRATRNGSGQPEPGQPDRRRKVCKVCGYRKRASEGQPTCGERVCRLAWAPPWAPPAYT